MVYIYFTEGKLLPNSTKKKNNDNDNNNNVYEKMTIYSSGELRP